MASTPNVDWACRGFFKTTLEVGYHGHERAMA